MTSTDLAGPHHPPGGGIPLPAAKSPIAGPRTRSIGRASGATKRFIGVIYRPESELVSHHAEASLPQQFDAFVGFDGTSAVTPLGPEHIAPGLPDTYPFGL